MKIKKLYTLSQFIDILHVKVFDPTDKDIKNYKLILLEQIVKYNEFLKQPLKKEMFINDIQKPKHLQDWKQIEGSASYVQEELKKVYEYQEAEKKVIFDGWHKSTYYKYHIINGKDFIDFSNADYFQLNNITVQILYDLAEATNGTLELNNTDL